MSGVDDSNLYALVIAAAQAAGPCPSDQEDEWADRVRTLAVTLHLTALHAATDIAKLTPGGEFGGTRFIAVLERVEVEASSRRGLLTLRTADGKTETIRTEQEDTSRGREMIKRARALLGHRVWVYRYNERMAGQRDRSVRMLAYLEDLGTDATGPAETAG